MQTPASFLIFLLCAVWVDTVVMRIPPMRPVGYAPRTFRPQIPAHISPYVRYDASGKLLVVPSGTYTNPDGSVTQVKRIPNGGAAAGIPTTPLVAGAVPTSRALPYPPTLSAPNNSVADPALLATPSTMDGIGLTSNTPLADDGSLTPEMLPTDLSIPTNLSTPIDLSTGPSGTGTPSANSNVIQPTSSPDVNNLQTLTNTGKSGTETDPSLKQGYLFQSSAQSPKPLPQNLIFSVLSLVFLSMCL